MIRVIGDRVLVRLPEADEAQDAQTGYTYQAMETTASGLVIAKPADTYNVQTATRGIVVQLGEKSGTVDVDEVTALLSEAARAEEETQCGRLDGACCVGALMAMVDEVQKLAPAPFDVAVGDCVLFPPSAGEQIEHGGARHVILRESEIIGIVEPQQEAA